MPRVVRCRKGKPLLRNTVYIGRPTQFGNPFHIGPDGTREEVVDKYRTYFEERLKEPVFRATLEGLRGKNLACWCAPAACHGDVILDYLEKTL